VKYRIGSFKRLTGFSEATLRYYERLGLLSPSRDDGNDYRSYDEEDLLQLVQVSQYSGFDIPLAELPGEGRERSAEAMRALLGERRRSIEASIADLYERLARIRLHEASFARLAEEGGAISQANIGGIYRLFLSDPLVASNPAAEKIAARWLSYKPFTHATMRIPLAELRARKEGPYGVELGLGMLERYFLEKGETLREPILYEPPNTCLQGMLAAESLGAISRADLEPFFERLAAGSLIPVGDLFGWIVYIAREGGRRRYYLSLRMAVA